MGLVLGGKGVNSLWGKASVKLVMVVMVGDYLELVIGMWVLQRGCRRCNLLIWVVWGQASGLAVAFFSCFVPAGRSAVGNLDP